MTTLETVFKLTPASFATSCIVGRARLDTRDSACSILASQSHQSNGNVITPIIAKLPLPDKPLLC
ncbi:MAG TPA: hypothetical protein VFN35_15005 [Ktedonobacteraceae bacterium]|nr:hypothetical protein [Ktedonobacteraceae bacterium]